MSEFKGLDEFFKNKGKKIVHTETTEVFYQENDTPIEGDYTVSFNNTIPLFVGKLWASKEQYQTGNLIVTVDIDSIESGYYARLQAVLADGTKKNIKHGDFTDCGTGTVVFDVTDYLTTKLVPVVTIEQVSSLQLVLFTSAGSQCMVVTFSFKENMK